MPQYPNGLGQALGDTLATCAPLHMSGQVWYVDSATGTDAASPAGLDANKPLATMGQAITNASDNDIVCFLSGHTETPAGVTISKKLCFVGAGSSGGVPTVVLTPAAADAVWLTVSGAAVQFRNIKFEDRVATSANYVLTVTGAHFRMVGCYVECDGNNTGAFLNLGSGADGARLVNTTFISTGISRSSQPAKAIYVGAAIADLELDGLVLSGGAYGWSDPYVFENDTAAITRLRGESVSLLLGADMALHASTTGYLNIQTITGSGQVAWAV